jgi:hypothetical protein
MEKISKSSSRSPSRTPSRTPHTSPLSSKKLSLIFTDPKFRNIKSELDSYLSLDTQGILRKVSKNLHQTYGGEERAISDKKKKLIQLVDKFLKLNIPSEEDYISKWYTLMNLNDKIEKHLNKFSENEWHNQIYPTLPEYVKEFFYSIRFENYPKRP